MNYEDIKETLEKKRQELMLKLQNTDLLPEDMTSYQLEMDNYQYILELTDMNYFQRGLNQI